METLDLFAFLDGVSPWWWIAFAVALGVVEMLTFTYFIIWLSLSAFAVAGALWIMPGMSGLAQVGLFAALAIVFTLAGWMWLRRKGPQDTGARLNQRAQRMIGRTGRALKDFRDGEGVIVIDDVRWRARLSSGEAKKGDSLRVIGAEGVKLICAPPEA